MAQDVRKYVPDKVVETVGGRWMGTCDIYGTLRQVLVEPLSPYTIYNIVIRDEGNMVIFTERSVVGPLVGNAHETILFPGIKTIMIENASKDEMFKLKLIYEL